MSFLFKIGCNRGWDSMTEVEGTCKCVSTIMLKSESGWGGDKPLNYMFYINILGIIYYILLYY